MFSLLFIQNKMDLYKRTLYTQRIKPFIGKGIIKVLTGQRRVGKSCLLKQIQEEIKSEHPNAKIVYINKEHEEYRHIQTDEDLFSYLADKFRTEDDNYLFIDEIQDIKGFEHVLRSLQAKETCDIFITGSNAKMLSGELSTFLSGRYIEFHIHSLSYLEFMEFHELPDNDETLTAYLTYGGMPYLSQLPLKPEIAFEYLRNVYSTIMLKDAVQRESIRNVDFLESLSLYVADNVGNLFSANNISRYLKSQRVDISPLLVINYLHALSNAYIIHKVGRIDVNGLKKFEIGQKYFFEDIGLRNCHLGFNLQRDIQKIIENAIFLHLKVLQYEVFVGQKDKKEIDFVGIKQGKKIYVQATYLMPDEKTREREFGNLTDIQDNYPKYVVSLDPFNQGSDVNGIHHIHLRQFLKMQDL